MQQMQIQGTEIQIKEYQGKRVVTFKDVDAVHQRKSGTASRNFRENRMHFIDGVDFYKINQPDEIRRLGISRPQGGTANEVTLITETGYLMLVKSFTDDLAWKVQRELVDSYFRERTEPDEQCMQEIIESGVPTVIVATDKLIRCAEIMAGCIEGNRSYVVNILKNIVPDIDKCVAVVPAEVTKAPRLSQAGYTVPFNGSKLRDVLHTRDISIAEFANLVGVRSDRIYRYCDGRSNPGTEIRNRMCAALEVPEGYFNKRTRRKR